MRTLDNILGRGEAAVTVPPLDGALRPNRLLDEASSRWPLPDVDGLAVVDGRIVASAGHAIHVLDDGGTWRRRAAYDTRVSAIAAIGGEGLAVAFDSGEIVVVGGRHDGRRYRIAEGAQCITALAASATDLFVASGSAANGAQDWQLDLLQRNASGSLWRIDLERGDSTRIAGGLSYASGLAIDPTGLVFAEAWKHRLVRIDPSSPGRPQTIYADLPGYPGRLALADAGYWLAVFAPRSQLVEFVLREPAYRRRMIATVPQPFWVAPKLRSGRSFYEPLQGGGVKQLGILKPWAPTMSAGLCVRLDHMAQPRFSLHSRADGLTHGVTAAVEHGGQLYVAARGDGVIVSLPLSDLGGEQ